MVALVAVVVLVLVAAEAVAGSARAHHTKEQMALAGAVEVDGGITHLAEVVMV